MFNLMVYIPEMLLDWHVGVIVLVVFQRDASIDYLQKI